MNKKVLVFYVNPNSGHHSAALAIQQAFQIHYPDVEVVVLDFMKYVNPVISQIMMRTYKGIIRRSPRTWDYLYDNPNVLQKTERMRMLTTRLNLTRIRKLMAEFKPGAVICTQAIPCGALSYYKEKRHMSVPLIGVSTDFSMHSYWFHDNVNYYVVPSEREKSRVLSRSIAEDKIRVFGIPIDPKFSCDHDRMKLKAKHGLDQEMFTMLIMGGSQGLGRIDRVVKRICRIPADFQLLIVAGTNRNLLKNLNGKRQRGKYHKYIRVLSHVDYVDELLEMADLLITKPGGLTTSEAMVKECPMILINPLPGQERQNAEYLVGQKVAVHVEKQDELIQLLSNVLHNPKELNEIIFQHQRLKRPNAAVDVANLVMGIHSCNT